MSSRSGAVAQVIERPHEQFRRGGEAQEVRLLSIVAAPEGVAHLQRIVPTARIFTAALDRCLNERKYILPGLGDFGDRLYGT